MMKSVPTIPLLSPLPVCQKTGIAIDRGEFTPSLSYGSRFGAIKSHG
jgi:hypothetical protein